jgi:hypothetical protein
MPSSAPPPGGRRAFFIAGRDAAAARSLAGRMGSSTADLNFPLFFPPTLISVTPSSGFIAGGDTITLSGMHFQPGATVDFDATAATVVSVTPTAIVATSPAHAAGTVNVTVTNPDFQLSTLANGFTYLDPGNLVLAVSSTGTRAISTDGGASWSVGSLAAGLYRAVAWNGTVFAAVGGSPPPVAATSPDGIAWTVRSIPNVNTRYQAVIWTGSVFAAVGLDSVAFTVNVIATSPDGITWTPRTAASDSNPAYFGLALNPANLVFAIGRISDLTDGRFAKAAEPPGTSWDATASTSTPDALNNAQAGFWLSSANKFAIVGAMATLAASSPDGLQLDLRTIPSGAYRGAAANGTIGVAVGDSVAASTTNCINWTARTIPIGAYRAVVWNGVRFVAVGEGGVTAFSVDGINWSVGGAIPGGANYLGVCSQ